MRTFRLNTYNALEVDSSMGNLLKWHIKNEKEDIYIKTSTWNSFNRIWLYESYSEIIVCRLLKEIGINDAITYYPCLIQFKDGSSTIGCYSKSFLKENEKYVSIAHLCKTGKLIDRYTFEGYKGYNELINDIFKYTRINYKNNLDTIIEADYITLNQDRHLGNIGFIYNYRTKEIKPAPIFDNGNTLFSLLDISGMEYDESLTEYIKSKPFYFKHEMQIQLIENRRFINKDISKTLRYIDTLGSIGLDKHRRDFIKQLLKSRIKI